MYTTHILLSQLSVRAFNMITDLKIKQQMRVVMQNDNSFLTVKDRDQRNTFNCMNNSYTYRASWDTLHHNQWMYPGFKHTAQCTQVLYDSLCNFDDTSIYTHMHTRMHVMVSTCYFLFSVTITMCTLHVMCILHITQAIACVSCMQLHQLRYSNVL